MKFSGLLAELGVSPHAKEVLSTKVEVGTRPPAGAVLAKTLVRRHLTLRLQRHDPAALLAGKLHAILQQTFTKGRDWYDLIWYLSEGTSSLRRRLPCKAAKRRQHVAPGVSPGERARKKQQAPEGGGRLSANGFCGSAVWNSGNRIRDFDKDGFKLGSLNLLQTTQVTIPPDASRKSSAAGAAGPLQRLVSLHQTSAASLLALLRTPRRLKTQVA